MLLLGERTQTPSVASDFSSGNLLQIAPHLIDIETVVGFTLMISEGHS
jgi:hypothetical protein